MVRTQFILIRCFFLTLISTSSLAQKNLNNVNNSQLVFIENKGQITDQYGHKRNDIHYEVKTAKGLTIFVSRSGLHYQFSKPRYALQTRKNKYQLPDQVKQVYDMQRVDIALEGADDKAEIIAEDKQAYHENYYTNALRTTTPVCTYKKVTYKNIYPHIDWVLYIKDNKPEYDFIVRPGGNTNDIKMRYKGAAPTLNSDGDIVANLPMGKVVQDKPVSYCNDVAVASAFKLEDGQLSFTVAKHKGTLVIDPTLEWATYFGGSSSSEVAIQGIKCDKNGDIAICGSTFSSGNIATSGAYDTVFAGGSDAFIGKI